MTSIIPHYLCEQDQWHVACSNPHATAAPDVVAALAQRDEYLERRQLGGFFQSIGGAIQSFFDPPPAPSPKPEKPEKPDPPKPERTTSAEAKPTTKAEKSSAAPATTLSPTTRTKTSVAASSKAASTSDRASSAPSSSDPTPITSSILESLPTDSPTSSIPSPTDSALPASSPSSTPAPSSGISGGAIAGIVIGILALLALLGALAVFLLRKKRKESNAEHLRALDGAGHGHSHGRADSMDERLVKPLPAAPMAAVAAAPMTIPRRPVGGAGAGAGAGYDEKKGMGVYRSDGHAGVELGTSFNMVELDSKEVPRPIVAELESPTTEAPRVNANARNEARGPGARRERDEMHF